MNTAKKLQDEVEIWISSVRWYVGDLRPEMMLEAREAFINLRTSIEVLQAYMAQHAADMTEEEITPLSDTWLEGITTAVDLAPLFGMVPAKPEPEIDIDQEIQYLDPFQAEAIYELDALYALQAGQL